MMMNAVSFVKAQPSVIQIEKPTLSNAKDEVLVEVHYSALDTALYPVIQSTFVGSMLHKQTDPLLCGWHFSGVVVEDDSSSPSSNDDGDDDEFAPGTKVFGFLQYAGATAQGSLAEYITVKKDALAVVPNDVAMDFAAAATTEPVTALQALRDVGRLTPSDGDSKNVLINGAGGQVGQAAIQIAKILGATEITAIVSTKDVEKVTQLGATAVIDRKKTSNIYDGLQVESFDVILDTPGKLSSATSLKYLKQQGAYVFASPDDMLGVFWGKLCALFSFTNKKTVDMVLVEAKKDDLDLIAKHLQEKNLLVDVDSIFDIKDIAKAMERQNDPKKNGRVVIKVQSGF